MSVYKQVRKNWLKRLTKKQRKQYKAQVRDIADSMLEAYEETIRLNGKASKDESWWIPIDETGMDIRIKIKLEPRY